jgi:hypothetical protein
LVRDWFRRATNEVPAELLNLRTQAVQDLLRTRFDLPEQGTYGIPEVLYPRTSAALLDLSLGEQFQLQQQAVRRLIIDGRFYDLRLRDDLHQAAIRLEDASTGLHRLFLDQEDTDSLAAEERRVRRYSTSITVMHRQLHGLHLRYRRKLRDTIADFLEGMTEIPAILSRGTSLDAPGEPPYVWPVETVRDWQSGVPPQRLLGELRESWVIAAERLHVLLNTELETGSNTRTHRLAATKD